MAYFELDGVAYRFSSKKMASKEILEKTDWDLEEIHGEIWKLQVFDLPGNLIWEDGGDEHWPEYENPAFDYLEDFIWCVQQVRDGKYEAAECPRFVAPSLLTL